MYANAGVTGGWVASEKTCGTAGATVPTYDPATGVLTAPFCGDAQLVIMRVGALLAGEPSRAVCVTGWERVLIGCRVAHTFSEPAPPASSVNKIAIGLGVAGGVVALIVIVVGVVLWARRRGMKQSEVLRPVSARYMSPVDANAMVTSLPPLVEPMPTAMAPPPPKLAGDDAIRQRAVRGGRPTLPLVCAGALTHVCVCVCVYPHSWKPWPALALPTATARARMRRTTIARVRVTPARTTTTSSRTVT